MSGLARDEQEWLSGELDSRTYFAGARREVSDVGTVRDAVLVAAQVLSDRLDGGVPRSEREDVREAAQRLRLALNKYGEALRCKSS